MSSAMKRRQSSSDDEGGGANWMDTYGDLVTLLLCFFVLLFAFSSIDVEKWQAIVETFTGSRSVITQPMSVERVTELPIDIIQTTQEDKIEPEPSLITKEDYEIFFLVVESIEDYVAENELQIEVEPNVESLTLILRFSDNILFESASATLRSEAFVTLDHVGAALSRIQEYIHMIRIEGHTDTVPINTVMFPDNWVLSLYRATNALRYMENMGRIDVEKLSCVGYGEFHPVDTNETVEGRARNRRVDFVIETTASFREMLRGNNPGNAA